MTKSTNYRTIHTDLFYPLFSNGREIVDSPEIVNNIWRQACRQRLTPGQTVSFTVPIKTERRIEQGKSGVASDKRLDMQIAKLFRERWGIAEVETRRRADQTSFTFIVSESFAERRMLEAHERERIEKRPMVTRRGQLIFA